MRSAWNSYFYRIYWDLNLLLSLVDGTKKCMHIASKSDLEQLIRNVDWFLENVRSDATTGDEAGGASIRAERRDCHCQCDGVKDCSQQHGGEL
jgi:hypothetical protein